MSVSQIPFKYNTTLLEHDSINDRNRNINNKY